MRTKTPLLLLAAYLLMAVAPLRLHGQVSPPAAYTDPIISYIRIWDATVPEQNTNALIIKGLQRVEGTGQKFFIDEQGDLYAVLSPKIGLQHPVIARILSKPLSQ